MSSRQNLILSALLIAAAPTCANAIVFSLDFDGSSFINSAQYSYFGDEQRFEATFNDNQTKATSVTFELQIDPVSNIIDSVHKPKNS